MFLGENGLEEADEGKYADGGDNNKQSFGKFGHCHLRSLINGDSPPDCKIPHPICEVVSTGDDAQDVENEHQVCTTGSRQSISPRAVLNGFMAVNLSDHACGRHVVSQEEEGKDSAPSLPAVVGVFSVFERSLRVVIAVSRNDKEPVNRVENEATPDDALESKENVLRHRTEKVEDSVKFFSSSKTK